MPMLGTFSFRSVGGDGVEDVDEDEKESDKERHPAGDDVRWYLHTVKPQQTANDYLRGDLPRS